MTHTETLQEIQKNAGNPERVYELTKAALAQDEQEQLDVTSKLRLDFEFENGHVADLTVYGSERDIKRLETRSKFWFGLEKLAQQRPWVGLTHQEISNEVISDEPDFVQGFVQGARWADTLLEGKNT